MNIGIAVLLASVAGIATIVIAIYLSIPTQTVGFTAIYGPRPVLGLVMNSKLQVIEVRKGGAADKAGVLPGDTVIGLDRVSFRDRNLSLEEASRAVASAIVIDKGQAVPLPVLRAGQEVTLQILPQPPPATEPPATPLPVTLKRF